MNICKRIRQKLKSRLGFTLAEMLMAVLILLMVSSVVAGGVPVAANAYYKVVDAANAQVLLSTTVTKLRRELAFASACKLKSGSTEIENYTNGEIRKVMTLVSKDKDGIQLDWIEGGSQHSEPLVRIAATTKGLYATFEKITYKDGFFTVEDLKVQKDGNENPLASVQKLKIRAIAMRDS